MHNFKILFLGLGLTLYTLTSCQFSFTNNGGKGPLVDKVYQLNFTGIEQDNGIESKVFKSTENKVVVNAPSDIIDKVLVEMTDNNIVHIHIKNNSNISTNKVKVTIYTTSLTSIDASSAAEIEVIDTFVSQTLHFESTSGSEISGHHFKSLKSYVKSSSGSNINIGIVGESVNLQASSGSEIELKGMSKNIDLKASSGSNINGEHFVSQQSNSETSSGANISIGVTIKAHAKASSGGNIDLYRRSNNMEITKEESSGGEVNLR